MKKILKLKIRKKARLKIAKVNLFAFIPSFIIAVCIECWFSKYTQFDVWIQSCIKSNSIFWLICIAIDLCIFFITRLESHTITIDFEKKKVFTSKEKIRFEEICYDATKIQKLFGLKNLFFVNHKEKEYFLIHLTKIII